MLNNKIQRTNMETVDASPVKSFFVSMLTRDITLEEAILDLLDNCVDGILRSRSDNMVNTEKPYEGFRAEITFRKDLFQISDNCGGIPWALSDYAFRMGRSKIQAHTTKGSVGVYGIGMKRAIFKMGKDCRISTQHNNDRYVVRITPEWITDENNWQLPVTRIDERLLEDGTLITIKNIYPDIASRFSGDSMAFKADLKRMIATHYAFIIDKGFCIMINGEEISPKPTRLVFNTAFKENVPSIKPFIYKTKTEDGIDVFLTVGFTRPIPSQEEVESVQEQKQYSSLDAGWTIICNDRAVLYCDRSELTGWGEAGVPRYHTQFIAISGIVEFKCDDASLLPTTTTKRGIDASSSLYLQIKNKMREGMRLFTDYTNKWKGRADESRKHIEDAGEPISLEKIKNEASTLKMVPTKKYVIKGEQYKPKLPLPMPLGERKYRIAFTKEVNDVHFVAKYLFDNDRTAPSLVGGKCFDLILKEAIR